MPEKEVINNSGYIITLIGITFTWVGWVLRKVFVIDRAYVSRKELNDNVKDLRDDIEGVHTRLDTLMQSQFIRKDRQ